MFKIRKIDHLVLIFLSLWFTTIYLSQALHKPTIQISRQDSVINFQYNFLKIVSSGYQRMISSLLWIDTLLLADEEHYTKKDNRSWLYLRLDTITSLDPHFYYAYQFAGQYLAIIKNDPLAGATLLRKGLKYYDNFWINYYLGYIYLFELADYDKAYQHYQKASTFAEGKNNHLLPILLANTQLKKNDYALAFQILQNSYAQAQDELLKKRLYDKMYTVKAEMDLKCLNSTRNISSEKCSLYDLHGKKYIKKGSIYTIDQN